METKEIRKFVENFFTLQECNILEKETNSITVEINEKTDKDLGYRPFYWSYIDQMKMKPQLLVRRFIFDPTLPKEEMSDEYLYFGSNRLHQIFLATKKRGQYVRLYENISPIKGTNALTPWIMVNYKIEFICNTKKEKILSLGINLQTKQIRNQFFEIVRTLQLTPKLPVNLFTSAPNLTVQQAIHLIEKKVEEHINDEDDTWAKKAWEKYEYEKQRVMQYFEHAQASRKNKKAESSLTEIVQWEEEKEKRLEELEWQYIPRINISPINMGIFYLHTLK